MSRYHQVHGDDLAELERLVPEILESVYPHLTPRLKVQFRRVKSILSDVRWNYGPPSEVEEIPRGGA